jgi:hypothetical protein
MDFIIGVIVALCIVGFVITGLALYWVYQFCKMWIDGE